MGWDVEYGGSDYGRYILTNGIFKAGTVSLGYNSYFEQDGGTAAIDTIELNDGGYVHGPSFLLRSGTFSCKNLLSVTNGADMSQSGGSLTISDTLYLSGTPHWDWGYRNGHPTRYVFQDGWLSASNIEIYASWQIYGSNNTLRISNPGYFKLGGALELNSTTAPAREHLGRFILASNAIIDMPGSNSILEFDASAQEAWASDAALIITNWTGNPAGGGSERLVFGANSQGLTPDQLSRVTFVRPNGRSEDLTAAITATGEVVPCEPTPAQYFDYSIVNGTITITRFNGNFEKVIIPAAINGLPVTAIGDLAFFNCLQLTSITIPKSVTTIGTQAFSCTGLTNITIPNGVILIGDHAFYGNLLLTCVTIPNSVTYISEEAFDNCSALLAINVDPLNGFYSSLDGVLFNKNRTMLMQFPCGRAGSYTVPGGVTTIRSFAFANCAGLTNVTIPNGVTAIGSFAFLRCSSLVSIRIPASVTYLGGSDFMICGSLLEITVDPLNACYSSLDGVLFNKNRTTLIEFPEGRTGGYMIPNGVTTIDYYAFFDCAGLTNITIPNGVTTIQESALNGCSGLSSIRIPASVTTIGIQVFQSCGGLLAITADVGNSFYSSVDGVLFNKTQTTLIQFPQGKAGSYTIPNSVTVIGDQAFLSCNNVINVTIPEGVAVIGEEAFYGSSRLTTVTIPNSVTNIDYGAFSGCTGLTNVSIGNGVAAIGDNAFQNCTALASITIPNSVTNIGSSAFCICTSLTNVWIGNGVTAIGQGAFYGCRALTSVTIPNSVTNIGDQAFEYCTNLKTVYFQGNAPIISTDAFYYAWPTVYYLPGTTGWGSFFADRPTAPWYLPSPTILNFGPSFGIQTNRFGFIISWASNSPVIIEATTNLARGPWIRIATNTLSNGSSYFSDPADRPARFYRVRSQ
jgi:hypothetical protein